MPVKEEAKAKEEGEAPLTKEISGRNGNGNEGEPGPGEPRNSSGRNHGCGYGSNSALGSPSSAFPILEFGALDPSAPEGFRRLLVSKEEALEELRRRFSNRNVFASVFRYESPDFEASRLYGPYYADLDSEDLDKALEDARRLVGVLVKLGIPKASIHIHFSGAKGFHVEVPLEAFGGEPHRDLNKIWKRLSEWIQEYLGGRLETLDWCIYDRRRLWRLPNSQNGKTGLYKVPISFEELFSATPDDIRDLAKAPREFSKPASLMPMKPKQNVIELWKTLVHEVESEGLGIGALPYQGPDPPYIRIRSHRSERIGSLEEAKAVRFLAKYWRRGYRNQLEMAFLGFCLKRGVGYESARRIIESVCDLTKDEEKAVRLKLVDYHYRTRRSLGRKLLAVSGLREIVRLGRPTVNGLRRGA